MNNQVAAVFVVFLYVLMGCVLLRSVLSFFPSAANSQLARLLWQVTEPMMAPIRRILPRTGGFDFSGLIIIILLQVMVAVVNQAAQR